MKRNCSLLKKIAAAVLAAGMTLSLASCGSGESSGDADTVTITYWVPKGEDTSYYEKYEDNPMVKYIEDNYTFNDKKLHLEFYIAPPGSESDNFSTLIGTGDYCGVMDMSMSASTVSVVDMYSEGQIWDLTELVPANMPNYMAFLEEHPECKRDLYTIVDGEKKILQLYTFRDEVDPNFQGFCYRRDWIAKYGSNPQTGEAFTYGFADENDPESWQDDVVFPNGTDEPLYISDWEWMFEIFDKAMEAQGISDGYCLSFYYLGYLATGDLCSGFGGGAPYWYNDNGVCVYGVPTDNFRAYLQCMNTWYDNGWLDPAFAEHTTDMFYAVDAAKVFQGKVGLWQGRQSTVGTQIDSGDEYTSGAVVYGCRQPINDIYGGAEQQNKVPNCMYQGTLTGSSVVLTDKLTEEEVITYLKFADFLFSEEGSLLKCGLNKEQYEECQDEFYTQYGLTEGTYHLEERDGEEWLVYNIPTSNDLKTASELGRLNPYLQKVKNVDWGFDRYLTDATEDWNYYKNTVALSPAVLNAVSVEDSQTINRIKANLDQFLARSVSSMIKGEGYDVWYDASWEQFCKDVNKYQAETITEIYQNAIDLVEQ